MGKAVAYYRVSRDKQGASGLGLEAQRKAVEDRCRAEGWELVAPPFTEVESGKRDDRPQLALSLALARRSGVALVVAKLDRLARNTRFLLTLIDSGADVVFCDLPNLPTGPVGRFMLTQMAAVAELEAGLISQRTKAALAAAKERGVKLGNPNGAEALRRARKGNGAAVGALKEAADRHAADLAPVIAHLQAEGHTSLPSLAKALNERQMRTPRGGQWHPSSVRNLLARLDEVA